MSQPFMQFNFSYKSFFIFSCMNFILGNEFDGNGFPCFFVYRLANCTKSTFTEFFTNYEIFEAHLKLENFGRFYAYSK